RLDHLHNNFTQDVDRKLIRQDLEERLPKYKKLKWWAMGMARLADFKRAEEAPDNLIRSREIAMLGHEAYPKSIGGQRCLKIIKSIEMPAYQLRAMASDGPNKKSIDVKYKNLTKIHFRAYPIDLKQQIKTVGNYHIFPEGRELEKIIREKRPSFQWETDLPDTPDFKMHKAFVIPPIKKPG
ncbi:MAG: hypothetical protein GY846_20040, partial [Deltaproteobacteria bacterium]|nr:hypothetical protein [Deltaproteobacteria bacterium]